MTTLMQRSQKLKRKCDFDVMALLEVDIRFDLHKYDWLLLSFTILVPGVTVHGHIYCEIQYCGYQTMATIVTHHTETNSL